MQVSGHSLQTCNKLMERSGPLRPVTHTDQYGLFFTTSSYAAQQTL